MPEKDELSVGTGATDPLTDDEEYVVGEELLGEDDGLRMDGLQVTYPATKEKPTPNVISQMTRHRRTPDQERKPCCL